jgi:NTE family protein
MIQHPDFTAMRSTALLFLLCLLVSSCAHGPATPALAQADGSGYRLANVTRPNQSDDMLVVLALSGGGTRAAALGYGVLEELHRTRVTVQGRTHSLLDEVDVISAVSGGTFPATYYALRGEKTFDEFENRVLTRHFESELARRIILNPYNWLRLPSGTFGKSDLFAELYDNTVFDHATFADLQKAQGPLVIINGTDINTGARFTFTQDQFDALCADLSQVTLARAVATSTALPPLLTPITFENRGGSCGRKAQPWQRAAEAKSNGAEAPGRALLRARALQSYDDKTRPYIHVFDGGLSENLGLAEVVRALEILKVSPDENELAALRRANTIVVIAVNALRYPEVDWDNSAAAPDNDTLRDQMWSIPVDRITLDGVEQVRDQLAIWQAAAPAGSPKRSSYFAQVTFDNLEDADERAYFNRVPTRLQLPQEQIDQVRAVAGKLLREAPAFKRLLSDLEQNK